MMHLAQIVSLLCLVVAQASATVTIPSVQLSSGVDMPVLNLGCGSGLINKNVTGAVASWIKAGATGIDGAHVYSWSVGNGKIAEGISEAGVPRERLFITSKTMCSRSAEKDVHSDLQDLNISSVDLLLIHSPRDCGLFGSVCSTWKMYNRLLAAGTTRAIGVSNFQLSDLKGLEACGSIPVLNQVSFSVGMYESYSELLTYMAANNITLEAYSPLQKGAVLRLPQVIQIAATHNVSAAQVALKWVVQHGAVLTTSVDGSESAEYLVEDLDLWSFELSEQEMRTLDAVKRTNTTTAFN